VFVPATVGCVRNPGAPSAASPAAASGSGPAAATGSSPATADASGLPLVRPSDWDAVAFNTARGRAGAIPAAYMAKIEGADGVAQHLGKHLPYVPKLPEVPARMLPLMWGDPALGYARHPNAAPTAEAPEGHWYNWIRVRSATLDAAEELESRFSGWPAITSADTGRYAGLVGSDPAAEEGRNTVYLVGLPEGVQPGSWIRIHGHCLTHGEYVDFLQLPS